MTILGTLNIPRGLYGLSYRLVTFLGITGDNWAYFWFASYKSQESNSCQRNHFMSNSAMSNACLVYAFDFYSWAMASDQIIVRIMETW